MPESTDGLIKRKIRKGAKYDTAFAEVAARMVSANMTEKEVGFFLGVKPATISKWKQRYEEFRLATESGSSAKEIAKSHMVASGLRSALGYDYEEVDQVYNINAEGEKVLSKETVKLRHRPVDKDLLFFFLINMSRGSGEWKNVKTVEVEQKKTITNISLTAAVESEMIRKLAGAALEQADLAEKEEKKSKKIDSKIIESVVVEQESTEG